MSMTTPATTLKPTYEDFTRVLTSYLRSNDRVLKRDLSALLPGFSESQIKAFTRQAVKDQVLAHGQEGFQGAWFLRLATPSGATTPTTRRTRAKSSKYYDLQKRIPQLLREHPDGLRYLEIAGHFGLNRNDAPLISVLKDLESDGTVRREEGKDQSGRKVTYSLASIARPQAPAIAQKVKTHVIVAPKKTAPAPAETDERDQMLGFLMDRYEEILNVVEGLKQQLTARDEQVAELERQLGTFREAALKYEEEKATPVSRPLPANLRDRLSQLQQRDQELTRTPLGDKLQSALNQKENHPHESRR